LKFSILVFIFILAVLAFLALKKKLSASAMVRGDDPWPFYAKKPLTQPEQILYHRLVVALPEYMILAQVQLSRVLGVKKGAGFHEWNNRINRLSLDFVACLKDSTVIAAIELDDSTHNKSDRAEADAKKAKALAAAGVKLVRWQVNALPDAGAIRQALAATR
jgi:hypothetical protein